MDHFRQKVFEQYFFDHEFTEKEVLGNEFFSPYAELVISFRDRLVQTTDFKEKAIKINNFWNDIWVDLPDVRELHSPEVEPTFFLICSMAEWCPAYEDDRENPNKKVPF